MRSPRLGDAGAEVAGGQTATGKELARVVPTAPGKELAVVVPAKELARAVPALLPLGNRILPVKTKHERLAIRETLSREQHEYLESMRLSRMARQVRWTEKTSASPFQVNQAVESERLALLQRERDFQHQQAQRKKAAAERENIREFVVQASQPDRLEELRKEKRKLLQLQRQLQAERELERKQLRFQQWDDAREARAAEREGRLPRKPERPLQDMVFH